MFITEDKPKRFERVNFIKIGLHYDMERTRWTSAITSSWPPELVPKAWEPACDT